MASITATASPTVAYWHTYLQSPQDGLIHELSMQDANSLNYSDQAFTIGPRPAPSTPIAVVSWDGFNYESTSTCAQWT